jgi:hypothetical protein
MYELIFALALLGNGQLVPTDGTEWLNPPSIDSFGAGATVGEENIFEVVASKEDVAIFGDLKDRSIVSMEESIAKYYAGTHMHCAKGLKPYLVRAVYGHGGTGGYSVTRIGSDILVSHGSLGRTSPANKSALVLCLDFAPVVVYTSVEIAE